MFNRLFTRPAKPRTTKMAAAAGAVGLFVKNVHRPCDAGAIFSFGNTLTAETQFTRDRAALISGLGDLDAKFQRAARNRQGEGRACSTRW